MRSEEERRIVAHLAAGSLNASQIADIAAIPRSTVRGWLRSPRRVPRQGPEPSLLLEALSEAAYSYLLGF
jgi:DNA-directed RNA polymerase specialized sigma24 family protein